MSSKLLKEQEFKVRTATVLALAEENKAKRMRDGGAMTPAPAPSEEVMRRFDTETPEFKERLADSMEWSEFKKYVPAGAEMENAIKDIIHDMKEMTVLERCAMLPNLNILLTNVIRVVGLVKAKQAEKPAQVNTQVNIDRGGFKFAGDEEPQAAKKTRPSRVLAKIAREKQARLDASSDPNSTSPPSRAQA
jgi:hypothetical protein